MDYTKYYVRVVVITIPWASWWLTQMVKNLLAIQET